MATKTRKNSVEQGSEVPEEIHVRFFTVGDGRPGARLVAEDETLPNSRFVRGSVVDDHIGSLLKLLEEIVDGEGDRDQIKRVLAEDLYVEYRKRWDAL